MDISSSTWTTSGFEISASTDSASFCFAATSSSVKTFSYGGIWNLQFNEGLEGDCIKENAV